MKDGNIIVNFVCRHSYAYAIKMIEGLVENGYKPLVVLSDNMPEIDMWRALKGVELYEVDGYQRITDFPLKLLKFLTEDVRKLKKINKERNIIAVYMPFMSYWTVFVNIPFGNRKKIFTMHDPKVHNKHNYVMRAFNYTLGRKADNIVILSETFKDYVVEHFKRKPDTVCVIPAGCQNEANKDNAVQIINYDDNKVNFVFQGRIEVYKGLEILAPAYKKLRDKYENITLTVAGSGDFGPYESLYKNLKDCTVVNRWLSAEEVVGLFNDRNTIAVLPYTSATQSGVIEVAMPCGTPIIATDCGGITEQIADGKTGYIIPPGDAEALYNKMEYVINNKAELDTIRQNGYERMEKLSWPNIAKQLGELF